MNDNLVRAARNVNLVTGDRTTTVDAIVETDLPANVLAEWENKWGALRRAGNQQLEREGHGEQCQHGHWAWDHEQKMIEVVENRLRLLGVRTATEWQCAMAVYREPVSAIFGLDHRLQVLCVRNCPKLTSRIRFFGTWVLGNLG